MKKIIKEILSFVLCLACLTTCIACGDNSVEQVDDNKTQLYVGYINNGHGKAFLEDAKERFEEKYANISFETGKTGVQIFFDEVEYGSKLLSTIRGSRTEVFFVSDVDYVQYVNEGLLFDISDWINTPLTEYGEEKSILDKINSESANFYNFNGEGYYGLPYVTSGFTFMYDVDLFNDKDLYFMANDSGNGDYSAKRENGVYSFINSNSKNPEHKIKSSGPNGRPGDYDDGLPATNEQFIALLDRMSDKGINPITWSGKYQDYMNDLGYSLWANYEGAENMRLNFTFDSSATGAVTNLIESIDSSGEITYMAATDITNDNGYLLQRQSGKYFALKLLEQIVDGGSKYYKEEETFKETVDHLSAQNNFLSSKFLYPDNPTGIFVDGFYWENEATATFDKLSQAYTAEKASKTSRKLGAMPLPHADDSQIGNKNVWQDGSTTMVMVNGSLSENKKDVAKTFIRFMHTNESLVKFTQKTSLIRPYEFTASEEDLAEMTYYGMTCYNLYRDSELLVTNSLNPTYLANISMLKASSYDFFTTSVGGTSYRIATKAFRSGISAEDYFTGVFGVFNETLWNGIKR